MHFQKDGIRHIIFDADDTLWENNIFYLKTTRDFISLAEEAGYDPAEIETLFDQLEFQVVREHGYGSYNYVYILDKIYSTHQGIDKDRYLDLIKRFKGFMTRKPDFFPLVPETIHQLSKKFDCFILTKGDQAEQEGKILRAGAEKLVRKYFVVAEKDDQTYLDLLSSHQWIPEECCMVGNSPKSDINPSLRIGMKAILIPYENNWKLDHDPLPVQNKNFLILDEFEDLISVFCEQNPGL